MTNRMMARIAAPTLAAVLVLAAFAPRGGQRPAAPPTVHTVRMVAVGELGKFEPATLTIHPGDQVRFVNVSGGPHNISFDPATLPPGMQPMLESAMADQMQPLWGPLIRESNESYTISFAGARPGRYPFFCVPHMYDRNGHMTTGMKGVIIVQ
ncbi:MAG TPA: plastocyanin/azurin family copper-binding protein [Longimicrobium sp.]|nr:plastocyanin/azurin family copper-binding protein [Longimicrobium sp.]